MRKPLFSGRTSLLPSLRPLAAILVPMIFVAACDGSGSKATATPEPTQQKDLSASDILDQNKASIVKVTATSPEGDGWGTGIVWGDGTHVLTNAHVVVGAGAVKVVDPADESRTYPARVVALSSCDDVALLNVDRATNLKPIKMGDSEKVKPGDHVVALGYPDTISKGPSNPILTEGTVSRIHATFAFGGQRELIQNTAPINPGNSGGPLFNSRGEVVGLNSYSARGKQSENYAITSNEAVAVAGKLQSGKNLDYIGVNLVPNDKDYANENDLAYIDGLAVTGVDPGSPADKGKPSGLDNGYLIFEVNGTSVSTVGDFCDIIRSHSSGETLRVRFGAYDENDKPYNNFNANIVLP